MVREIDLAEIQRPGYWREREEGARAVADNVRTSAAKLAMYRLADGYAKLARDAERIAKNRPKVT